MTPDRVVCYFTIGFSANDPAHRQVGWSLSQTGWLGFVKTIVQPLIDAGYTRFLLDNPGGIGADGLMSFDQFTHADVEAPWLVKDFVEAWSPLTAAGHEVIAYVGTLQALSNVPEYALRRRVEQALAPALAAGCSLAFDDSSYIAADSPAWRGFTYLRQLGVRVPADVSAGALPRLYLEDWPGLRQPHLWGQHSIIREADYAQRLPNPPAAGNAPRDLCTGERVRKVDGMDPATMLPAARKILADGDTASIQAHFLLPKTRNDVGA